MPKNVFHTKTFEEVNNLLEVESFTNENISDYKDAINVVKNPPPTQIQENFQAKTHETEKSKKLFQQAFEQNNIHFNYSSYFNNVNQQLILYMTKFYFPNETQTETNYQESLLAIHFFEASVLLAISSSLCDLKPGQQVFYQTSLDLGQLYENIYEVKSVTRQLLDSKMYLEVVLQNSPQMMIVKIPESLDELFQHKFFCPVKILEWNSNLDLKHLFEVYLYRKQVLPAL